MSQYQIGGIILHKPKRRADSWH